MCVCDSLSTLSRCYPSDDEQANGANCAVRARSGLGSSKGYAPSIASMGYEGGSGYTSGDPTKTAWANWAAAYLVHSKMLFANRSDLH